MDGSEHLRLKALEEAARIVFDCGTDSSPQHIAAMAWLDGYANGHRDVTEYAIQILGEREQS